jgi:hypothetical protein
MICCHVMIYYLLACAVIFLYLFFFLVFILSYNSMLWDVSWRCYFSSLSQYTPTAVNNKPTPKGARLFYTTVRELTRSFLLSFLLLLQ